MPVNVVHTKAQENAWNKAKEAAAKSKGKGVSDLKDDDWGLVMHIYQKVTKSEELPELAKSELMKAIGSLAPKMPMIKAPMKVGSTAVKTPKSKMMPSPFAKPSVFFKSEDIKNPRLKQLGQFVESKRNKTNKIK